MNVRINSLVNEINKSIEILNKIIHFYHEYTNKDTDHTKSIMQQEYAIVISEIIANYYTCIETIFLRISQYFENDLKPERWHKHLLDKMRIQIDDVRIQAISDDTYYLLLELLKFRHFKRYYFEFNYDIDKINFLEKKLGQLDPLIRKDLEQFLSFMQQLAKEDQINE